MNEYDRNFSRHNRYGQDYDRAQRGARYGSEYQGREWGPDMSGLPAAGFGGRGVGMYRQWGTAGEFGARGYDRGEYGGTYDRFGGYPGGEQPGMYYGGRGYDAGYARGAYGGGMGSGMGSGMGGYDRGMRGGSTRGYGGDYARQPFVPEAAYQQHPEFNRPPMNRGGSGGGQGTAVQMDDNEIRQAVRENLHQDAYLDVDRINVEVKDGVVTLTGEVDDFMEARYAWDDAWEVDGVHGVVNQLTVRVDEAADTTETGNQAAAGGKGGRKQG